MKASPRLEASSNHARAAGDCSTIARMRTDESTYQVCFSAIEPSSVLVECRADVDRGGCGRSLKDGVVLLRYTCQSALDSALPFGGYKQSGWGRELGEGAIDEYTQYKAVNIAL